MNCRQAEPQIFAERDGALDQLQRAALAEHVGQCAVCRRLRDGFAVTIETWRVSTQEIRVPDAELEWQKLRREIRGGAGSAAVAKSARRTPIAWFAVPLAAAAAIAVTLFINSDTPTPSSQAASVQAVAKATPETDSTVVFVDDKTGWTFVVAADNPHRG